MGEIKSKCPPRSRTTVTRTGPRMAHLPSSGLCPWRSRLPPMGKGPLPACAPAPALCCMHRPSRMPSPPVCLRPADLTAAPPGHRRLSGASPCRAERVRETEALQQQPNNGLFEVRRRPHRRPLVVAAPQHTQCKCAFKIHSNARPKVCTCICNAAKSLHSPCICI